MLNQLCWLQTFLVAVLTVESRIVCTLWPSFDLSWTVCSVQSNWLVSALRHVNLCYSLSWKTSQLWWLRMAKRRPYKVTRQTRNITMQQPTTGMSYLLNDTTMRILPIARDRIGLKCKLAYNTFSIKMPFITLSPLPPPSRIPDPLYDNTST